MNFKAYDIISKLIPGYAFVFSLIFLYENYGSYLGVEYVLPLTIVAYFTGYLIDTLSSWLEGIYYFTWKGKPSTRLLSKYKGVWKVPAPHFLAKLKKDSQKVLGENVKEDDLFRYIQSSAHSINKERLNDFLQNFIFARVMLTVAILLAVLFGFKYYSYWQLYIISISVIIILWLRAKQLAYYYEVEVLRVYHSEKIK